MGTAFHLLGQFDLPPAKHWHPPGGAFGGGSSKPTYEITEWSVGADQKNGTYSIKTFENPDLRQLRLACRSAALWRRDQGDASESEPTDHHLAALITKKKPPQWRGLWASSGKRPGATLVPAGPCTRTAAPTGVAIDADINVAPWRGCHIAIHADLLAIFPVANRTGLCEQVAGRPLGQGQPMPPRQEVCSLQKGSSRAN